ncbi:hypothetical protein FKR81_42185 [Lentzea tibetensis]|uniref:Uncharacterized protein n=1 Tax=Lentzea tibetensis TaxID=2591470 RepID=A0A563EER3_9PSEU|nr:hypothetical protein [Lentzea tibetensis]TWP43639.1 hypothetical protein FKR81_42185 [Lentzea tibetensis]
MNHPHGDLDVGGGSALALVLRLALVLVTAFVAGTGLVRPQLTTRRVRHFALALAGLSAALVVTSVLTQEVNVVAAVVHVVLVAAVPLLLGRPAVVRWVSAALVLLLVIETSVGDSGVAFVVNTVFVAVSAALLGVGPFRDLRPLALSLGVVLVLAGAVRLATSGIAFDRRIYESGLGLVLLAVVLVAALTLVLRNGYVVALALVAWAALPAVAVPPSLPEPGVPVLVDARLADRVVPVLVSPHRPGRNLVHFPASAGNGLRVGDVPAVPRAGAPGTWAEVDLPPGRGEVVISDGAETVAVRVDPGTAPGPGPDAECATAALGTLIAGLREVLTSCPSDSLSTEDSDSLQKLVGFLKAKGTAGIRLVTDTSPRSTKAAELVRASGLRIDDGKRPDNALVVVSGWETAHEALTRAGAEQAESPVYTHGLYVAPWLLHTPIATAVTTVSVPLRFDPREPLPVGYAVAVGNGFGGEDPTPAGFRAWVGRPSDGGVQIYAVAQVSAMPMGPNEVHGPGMPMQEELAGQWVPKATVVPVSPLLS